MSSKTKVPTVRPRDTRRNGPEFMGAMPMKTPQKWAPEEDELLRKAVAEIGPTHWKLVAERVPGRNHVQCMQRYWRVLKPGLKKGHWTPEEDETLRRLAERGFTTWLEAAKSIPGRSAKQCRDRWRNHLESTIKHGPWEPEEDALLLELHAKHGNRWAAIARCISGRTENAVKIHCKTLLSKMRGGGGGSGSNSSQGSGLGEDMFDQSACGDESEQGQGNSEYLRSSEGDEEEEEDDDPDETTDDLSSISPLPSPMAQPAQWPWATTPTHVGQIGLSSQQPTARQGGNNGMIRTNPHLSSFAPHIMAPSITLRRSSFPQVHAPSSLSNGMGSSARLSSQISMDANYLAEAAALLEVPTLGASSQSQHANAPVYTTKKFNGAIPLALRMDLPPIVRASESANLERYSSVIADH